MNDQDLQELIAISERVEEKSNELLSQGLDETTMQCPICSSVVYIRLDYCCGVNVDCEKPRCFHMHMNLGLNFGENHNGTH